MIKRFRKTVERIISIETFLPSNCPPTKKKKLNQKTAEKYIPCRTAQGLMQTKKEKKKNDSRK